MGVKKCPKRDGSIDSDTVMDSKSDWELKFSLFSSWSLCWSDGAILADDLIAGSEMDMQVICSWCRGEGRIGLVGEKAPLEDPRETHSICIEHEKTVRARWTAHQGNVNSCRMPGESVKDQSSYIRWVVRSVVRFYVNLRGAPKIFG